MADKAISELTAALEIFSNDLFVLEQNGEAKKLQGTALKQYISEVQINKIESVTFDTQKRCHIRLSDGTEIVSQSLGGPKGDPGDRGETGPAGPTGPTGADGDDAPTITNITVNDQYHLIITLSNGQRYDAGYCRGPAGAGTGDMLSGTYDPENGARQVAFKDSVVPKTDYSPSSKTAEMTQEVGKDENGKLWTNPAPASTGDMLKSDYDASETVKTAGGIVTYVTSAINSAISDAIGGSY